MSFAIEQPGQRAQLRKGRQSVVVGLDQAAKPLQVARGNDPELVTAQLLGLRNGGPGDRKLKPARYHVGIAS